MTTPSALINKVCLSGINAIYLADQMIASGEADIVVAGGMESMTNAPYLLLKARGGYRFGDDTIHDSMIHDGLFCAFEHCAMGEGTERYAASAGIARAPQDELAAASHERAARAHKDGLFDDELVPVAVPQRRGDPIMFATDEGVRANTTRREPRRVFRPRSPKPATSPPATPRRSPTAPPPSSSRRRPRSTASVSNRSPRS